MAASVDDVLRTAIHAQLAEVTARLQQDLDGRFAKLEQTLEELSSRAEARSSALHEVREVVEINRASAEVAAERSKADLESLAASLRLQLERVETDEEGSGGLHQLRGRLEKLTQELASVDTKLQDQNKQLRTLRSRIDGADESIASLTKQCDGLRGDFQLSAETLQSLESASSALKGRQQALDEDLIARHEQLWGEVTNAVEEVRREYTTAMQQDLSRRRDEIKQHSQSHVRYVTQLLASAHTERKNMETCKGLLQVWREQTWAEARRRTALRWLANAFAGIGQRRERHALERWRRATTLEGLACRLRQEYRSELPDVLGIIEGTGLRVRCEGLEETLASHRGSLDALRGDVDTKCSSDSLSRATAEYAAQLGVLSGDLGQLKVRMAEWVDEHKQALAQGLAQAHEKHERHCELFEAHKLDFDGQLEQLQQRIAEVGGRLGASAKSEEVQTLMRDVLVVWGAIKQLDAAKADKATLDAFATEVTQTHNQAAKRAEDMHVEAGFVEQAVQREVQREVREEAGRLREEVDVKVAHWEQMWGKLAGLVEDLLSKVGELQSAKVREASVASNDAATLRPSSLPPPPTGSRRAATSGGQASMPALRALPGGGLPAGPPAAAVAALHNGALSGAIGADYGEAGMPTAWEAKGAAVTPAFAVAGIAAAQTPTMRAGRSLRPSSASLRRPHDRR